ncbi:MAG: Asp-tRNA(Asn)/Glu-tRNA(Gln) amidotransferase GatCAB subunit C [Candidatus Magasanikbacteria bacterium CG10_big_fil_rev_8_21_14_0_10_40_10]|uniref:Aspartyl/glutamyl-tRNA(Asn/Gln) amidotransferase subunit C n=1 Tax=Candidatus Magasanikbacteria bacterium CG10_big_fil_rev_8_21_14_0_10_40_10 TaxID=1974648 RepID=A0A2M6W3I6_9BACT|nr:MAG: Asp-tRNA(Asn)/Glu-tRNA(Gln) amidotransferase GatCAB subunit C [Candidatus Magasanikbacteria bacterium CG10_big_fil_rev_8_21_14_0_10_40_10]
MLTKKEVQKIASLARINLTEKELERHAETISAVLDYMKILNEAPTDGVLPTCQVTGLANVARADEIKKSDFSTELVKQMNGAQNNKLKVSKVFE